jgi:NAD(P)-dependent dehydrogenase (short-subunit alcohol dehydrogenase family)
MSGYARTVVITGGSSGIGKAAVRLFAEKGWNVVATMRRPEAEKDLVEADNLKLVPLDVQDPASVRNAVKEAIAAFGAVDVWVNNAGYGALGPVEAGARDQIQRQFDVNLFGLIECIQAITPHFRARRAGTIINVSSVGGVMTSPGFSVYNSSKFAVEGLSEGLWYELGMLGIQVKIVEPGIVKTEFSGRSMDVWDISELPDYAPLMEKVEGLIGQMSKNESTPELIAATLFKAATDPSNRLRYLAGSDARMAWRLRRWLGPRVQMRIFHRMSGV